MTPLPIAHQALLSMEFSRQEYWSGLPFPSPGDLPNPEIECWSPALKADSLPSVPPGKPCARVVYADCSYLLKCEPILCYLEYRYLFDRQRLTKTISL